jgi:hypothetical protein
MVMKDKTGVLWPSDDPQLVVNRPVKQLVLAVTDGWTGEALAQLELGRRPSHEVEKGRRGPGWLRNGAASTPP